LKRPTIEEPTSPKVGYADHHPGFVELAAHALAAGLSHGDFWPEDGDVTFVGEAGAALARRGALRVVKRGTVVEGAARKIRESTSAHQHRVWHQSRAFVVLRNCAPREVMSALSSLEQLTGPYADLLQVYAGDFSHWPAVERFAVACGHSREAAADGMARILWSRTHVALDARAKQLSVRAEIYRADVRSAFERLWRWLCLAAGHFLESLGVDRTEFHRADGLNGESCISVASIEAGE
jgi:hypothetical protein